MICKIETLALLERFLGKKLTTNGFLLVDIPYLKIRKTKGGLTFMLVGFQQSY